MHKLVFVLLIQIVYSTVSSQTAIINGRIYDQSNHQGVDFANVYLDSSYIATSTHNGGSYELLQLTTGKYNLCVSHIGYNHYKKEINLHQGVNNIDIYLTPHTDTITPVVITGTGTHHRIDDVPVQTEIITKKDIAELSGRNVEEILSTISSSIDYTNSSMGTNIKINGLGKDYVLVLLNGKRLNGGIGGYTDLSRINTEDIEQIEVVKGASSTLYGSDAIAGVINIITKKPKQHLTFTNNTRAGEYGEIKQLNSFNYSTEKFTSKTTFHYKQKDGYQLNNLKYNTKWESNHDLPYLVKTYYKPVNKAKAYTISQVFEYKISDKLNLNSDLSWYEKRIFFPFKAQMHDYYYNNRYISAGGKYKLQHKNYIDFNIDFNHYLYYTEYPYKYNETYTTSDQVINVTYYPGDRFKNSDEITINVMGKGVLHLNPKNKLSTGIEVMGEYLEAKYRLTEPHVSAYTYSFFAQDEIKINPQMDLVAGFRSIYHSKAGFVITPKITFMYKQKWFTHRLTYSNGFKSPTLKELYYYYESDRMGMYRLYLGNSELKSQHSHYLSLSTEFKTGKFRSGINAYINYINHKIDYKIVETSYDNARRGIEETKVRYNIDEARNLGIDWHFSITLLKKLLLSGGYSYVDARNLTQDIRLNGVSEHSATAKASWTKRWNSYKLNLTLSGVYKSDRFYLDEDSERSYADPYQLWKLTTNHTIKKIKFCDLTCTAGIDNIFNYIDDRPYGSHYGTLNPGRTFFAGINIKLTKK